MSSIPRTPVESSHIASVGYDATKMWLYVEFKSHTAAPNPVYVYYSVPYHVYRALMEAPSIGKYFQANVRKKYSGAKVEEAAQGVRA